MKKFLSILLVFLMLCSVVTGTGITVNGAESTVSGTSVTSGDFEYEALDETTAQITGYVGADAEVTIPTTLDGYTVVSIGYNAFYNCTGLTSITIPDSVTSIGERAFYGCTSLTSITIPNSVTSIGNDAFGYCYNLTSVTIGDSVTSVGNYAFYKCTSLTSVTIPDSVTSISEYAFYNCTSLTSITIPNSVTSIGNCAFEDCTGLTFITVDENNTVYDSRDNCNGIIETSTNKLIIGCCNTIIPDSVTSISDYAFSKCTSLTSITIPDSVTSIGEWAFYNCTSLTSITIPDSVTSIGSCAFDSCTSLTSVTIGDSVTSIGDYAFSGCTSLTSVTIGDSVTSIGSCVFGYCTNLTSVTIPDSVTSIGGYAFGYCSSLTSITIPDSVTSIGGYAFGYCSSLTSITIPDSVTSIAKRAFSGCTSLTSVTIGDSVTSIGDYAFLGCTSLTSVTIPDSVTSIGDSAFYGCESLVIYCNNGSYAQSYAKENYIKYDTTRTSGDFEYEVLDETTAQITGYVGSDAEVTIPTTLDGYTVVSIGEQAFFKCTGLTSITIPDSVTSIGKSAFAGCTALANISIPNSVTSIGTSSLYCCSSLTEVTIPDSVTSIGEYTFAGCTGLKEIVIPDGVTGLGTSTFAGCTSLASATIGSGATSISKGAFYNCTGLTTIIVDEENTVYDSRNNCNAIIETATNHLIIGCCSTIIPDDVTSIGEKAFYNCIDLTSITIPASVTSIGDYAFSGCDNLVMYGYDGSYAQTYAEENEITFELISEEENTVTIKFAVPNTLESKKWHSWNGVDLAYGDRGSWKELTRIEMTATGETYTSNGVEGSQYLEAGEWAVYAVTLTADQIEALENAKYVVFINGTNYHRTTLLQKYNVFGGASVAEFDGGMYVIDSIDTTRSCELDSYLGSWIFDEEASTEAPTEAETDAPVEETTMTIYFENNWYWPDAKAYWWGSTTGENPEWNGVEMTYVTTNAEGADIYCVEVPTDITGLIFNGTGEYGTDQSADITEGWYDGICYYMTYDADTNTKPCGSYPYAG